MKAMFDFVGALQLRASLEALKAGAVFTDRRDQDLRSTVWLAGQSTPGGPGARSGDLSQLSQQITQIALAHRVLPQPISPWEPPGQLNVGVPTLSPSAHAALPCPPVALSR